MTSFRVAGKIFATMPPEGGPATTPLLRELLTESWRRKAPKRLAGPDG